MISNLHQIINSLVLALSLATIILTLMTYLLYKIKQLPKGFGSEPQKKMESTFFKRYNPYIVHKAEVNLAKDNEVLFARLRTLPAFFVFMGVLIFGSLMSAQYFNGREITSSRKSRSENYKKLVAEGLLKRHDFNPTARNPKLKERIGKRYQSLNNSVADLADKKVLLYHSPQSQRHFAETHKLATKGWERLFQRKDISFHKSSDLKQAHNYDVIVLPQTKSLNQTEKDQLEAAMNTGVALMITGLAGGLDGTGEVVRTPWVQKILPITFEKNEDLENTFPTLASSAELAWSPLPPGYLMNWMPLDNSFKATSKKRASNLYESNYQGRIRDQAIRSYFDHYKSARVAWFALDPILEATDNSADQETMDATLLSSLVWAVRSRQIALSNWRDAHQNAVILSVDAETQFSGSLELQELFARFKMPASIFVVTDSLKEVPEVVTGAEKNIDFGTLTLDHRILSGQSLTSQFESIEKSRLILEELSGRSVQGFHPPGERFDETTLNATAQNKMKYLVGDQRIHRFAPLWIDKSSLLYFPRVTLDDANIVSDASLAEPSQIAEALIQDMERVHAVGGLYYLSMHSQIFGQKPYLEAVEIFLEKLEKKSTWKTEFKSMSKWWGEREGLQVSFSTEKQIEIENTNSVAVEGSSFTVDLGSARFSLTETSLSKKPAFKATALGDGVYRVIVPSMSAKSKLLIPVQKEEKRTLASPQIETSQRPVK